MKYIEGEITEEELAKRTCIDLSKISQYWKRLVAQGKVVERQEKKGMRQIIYLTWVESRPKPKPPKEPVEQAPPPTLPIIPVQVPAKRVTPQVTPAPVEPAVNMELEMQKIILEKLKTRPLSEFTMIGMLGLYKEITGKAYTAQRGTTKRKMRNINIKKLEEKINDSS